MAIIYRRRGKKSAPRPELLDEVPVPLHDLSFYMSLRAKLDASIGAGRDEQAALIVEVKRALVWKKKPRAQDEEEGRGVVGASRQDVAFALQKWINLATIEAKEIRKGSIVLERGEPVGVVLGFQPKTYKVAVKYDKGGQKSIDAVRVHVRDPKFR